MKSRPLLNRVVLSLCLSKLDNIAFVNYITGFWVCILNVNISCVWFWLVQGFLLPKHKKTKLKNSRTTEGCQVACVGTCKETVFTVHGTNARGYSVDSVVVLRMKKANVYRCISVTLRRELLESNATRLWCGANWKMCYGPAWCNRRFLSAPVWWPKRSHCINFKMIAKTYLLKCATVSPGNPRLIIRMFSANS